MTIDGSTGPIGAYWTINWSTTAVGSENEPLIPSWSFVPVGTFLPKKRFGGFAVRIDVS